MAEDPVIATNSRVPNDVAQAIRETRSDEQWESYDTVVIGAGAAQTDGGWFNTWATFASASDVQWFRARTGAVGRSYSNRPFDRLDYHFDVNRIGIEFYAPPAFGQFAQKPTDVQIMPEYFVRHLPNLMGFSFKISDTDEILALPGSHAPAGAGAYGGIVDGAPTTQIDLATNGQPLWANRWAYLDEPVMIPRGATFIARAQVDSPLKEYLQTLATSPGVDTLVGDTPAALVFVPRWYAIRITLVGKRYVQLRGGRSAV